MEYLIVLVLPFALDFEIEGEALLDAHLVYDILLLPSLYQRVNLGFHFAHVFLRSLVFHSLPRLVVRLGKSENLEA